MKSYHEMMLLNDFLPNLEELYLSSNDLSDIPSEYLLPGKETEDSDHPHHKEENLKKHEEPKSDHFFIVGK
jgi:Leucine-rich repeat (LRR) protein